MTVKTVVRPRAIAADVLAVANVDNDANLGTGTGSSTKVPTQQAAKAFVEGRSWKTSVLCATVVAGNPSTGFEADQLIDGVALVAGERILIKDQSTASENGIYVVQASGAPVRATDADSAADLRGCVVSVREGAVNADTQWACQPESITLGTTALTFVRTNVVAPGGMAVQTLKVNNSTATQGAVDVNDSTPAAGTGFENVGWQKQDSGGTSSISGRVKKRYFQSQVFGRLEFTNPITSCNLGAEFGGTYTLISYRFVIPQAVTAKNVGVWATTISNPGPGSWTLNLYKNGTKVGTFSYTLGAAGVHAKSNGAWSVESGQNLDFAAGDDMYLQATGTGTDTMSVWAVLGWEVTS